MTDNHDDPALSMDTPELEREVAAVLKRLVILSRELMARRPAWGYSTMRRVVTAAAPTMHGLEGCARLFTEISAAFFRASDVARW